MFVFFPGGKDEGYHCGKSSDDEPETRSRGKPAFADQHREISGAEGRRERYYSDLG